MLLQLRERTDNREHSQEVTMKTATAPDRIRFLKNKRARISKQVERLAHELEVYEKLLKEIDEELND